jgi:hypothetical protein
MNTQIDSDGKTVQAGDRVQFSYGIPPIGVTGAVVLRGGRLVVLTPGHRPRRLALDVLSRHVGDWWRVDESNKTITKP